MAGNALILADNPDGRFIVREGEPGTLRIYTESRSVEVGVELTVIGVQKVHEFLGEWLLKEAERGWTV